MHRHGIPTASFMSFDTVEDAQNFFLRIQSKEKGTPVKGDVDLIVGGPPCQGFSGYNRFRTPDDPRNSLMDVFLNFVNELSPRFVLIENVPGIISLGKGTVVQQIYNELENLGYSVNHKILFAGHYGVPQMRFRTIFLALKGRNRTIEFPDPVYC